MNSEVMDQSFSIQVVIRGRDLAGLGRGLKCQKGMGVGGQFDATPLFSWQQVADGCKEGKKLIVIEGKVCDVGNWAERHPGGKVKGEICSHIECSILRRQIYVCMLGFIFLPRRRRN